MGGCQRRSQLHADDGALVGNRLDTHRTFEALDVGAHHIQTHPPTGNFGDEATGGKSGHENQLLNLLRCHRGEVFFSVQFPFDRRFFDFF